MFGLDSAKILIIIAIFVVGSIVGSGATAVYYKSALKTIEIEQLKAINDKKDAEAQLKDVIASVTTNFVAYSGDINTKKVVREKETIKYVPIDKITLGFVEYHNAAIEARDLVPMENPGQLSAKTQQDLGVVLDSNYTNCNRYIKQLTGLQEVVENFQKVYNK